MDHFRGSCNYKKAEIESPNIEVIQWKSIKQKLNKTLYSEGTIKFNRLEIDEIANKLEVLTEPSNEVVKAHQEAILKLSKAKEERKKQNEEPKVSKQVSKLKKSTGSQFVTGILFLMIFGLFYQIFLSNVQNNSSTSNPKASYTLTEELSQKSLNEEIKKIEVKKEETLFETINREINEPIKNSLNKRISMEKADELIMQKLNNDELYNFKMEGITAKHSYGSYTVRQRSYYRSTGKNLPPETFKIITTYDDDGVFEIEFR